MRGETMEDRLAAITAFLDKRVAKEQKDFKPKKLQKKLVKKGVGQPQDFTLWLEQLQRGDIEGYRFDADREVILCSGEGAGAQHVASGVSLGATPPKRKNKRKPDKPESTIEMGGTGLASTTYQLTDAAPKVSKGTGGAKLAIKSGGKSAVRSGAKPGAKTSVTKPAGVETGAPLSNEVGVSPSQGAVPLSSQQGAEVRVSDGEKDGVRTKKRKVGSAPAPASDHLEESTWRSSVKRSDIKTGAWAADERQMLQAAIRTYATNHDLDPDNLDWLIGKKQSHDEGRGMWTEIARGVPQRSIKSVAAAALRLFHPYAGKGAFSEDEDEALRGLVQAHGNKWTEFSMVLKRTPEACRLRWRDIKDLSTRQSGRWSEEEERALVAAVEKYGNPSKLKGDGKDRRVLLDNIDWEAVVPHVPTRNRTQCVAKWYLRLAPSMAARGLWGQGDDKKLMKSLWSLLKNCARGDGLPGWHETTVPWGELVQGRTGDECRRRWALLKKHVSNAKNKEFVHIVGELVRRYFPSLAESAHDEQRS